VPEPTSSKFGDLMRSIYEKTVTPARTSTPELDIDAQISELAQERAKYGINPFKAVKESERSSKESKQKEYTDKIDSLREMKRNLGNTSKAPTTIPSKKYQEVYYHKAQMYLHLMIITIQHKLLLVTDLFHLLCLKLKKLQ
jgi:hypothetical protein